MAFDKEEPPLLAGVGDLLCYRELVPRIVDIGNVYNWE